MAESNGCANELRSVTRGTAGSTNAVIAARLSGSWEVDGEGVAMLRDDSTPPKSPRVARGWPRNEPLLFGFCDFRGFHSLGSLRVLTIEPLDAASGIEQFLLAGKEWVTTRANFDSHQVAFMCGPRLKRAAARAVHADFMIVGMNAGFHSCSCAPAGLRGIPPGAG